MSVIENPFIKKVNINIYDEEKKENVILDNTNIVKYYQKVYILTKLNDFSIPIDFFEYELDIELYNNVSEHLILYETTPKILKNKNHFNNMFILSNDKLEKFNKFNYTLNKTNVVILFLNISLLKIIKYLEQYETTNNLENLYNIQVLNKYYNNEPNICYIINNLEETNYWTKNYNCLVNINNLFDKRKMYFKLNKMTDTNVVNIIRKFMNQDDDGDYLANNKYIDISSNISLEKNGYYLYKLNNENIFTKNDINNLFETLNEKQQFLLFSNLMISKKYCHLVINNIFILKLMKNTLIKYMPLYKYLLSYSWIRFYLEECIKKTSTLTTDAFIFDIDTASELVLFPFDHNNPKSNPYMPLLVADNILDTKNNICGLPFCGREYGGISNLSDFKRKMNIFSTRNANNDLFENYDFIKNKAGVTGSLITACVQKNNPLLLLFKGDDRNEIFNNYLNEYYVNSDIDVLFSINNDYEFIDNVKDLYNTIVTNVCRFSSPYAEPSHVKLILNKTAYLFVTNEFIINNIKIDNKNVKNIVNYVMNNLTNDNIYKQFHEYYLKLFNEKYENISNDIKNSYPELFDKENVNLQIYINKKSDNVELELSYKYSIESKFLPHKLELFSTKYNDIMSLITKFHLPCVRGYYNGNVYLTPSCISSHMTFMNIDYKYVAGTKDPINIINKYRMRGFGTWLNNEELKIYKKYFNHINKLYNIVGPINITNSLFKPRQEEEKYKNVSYVDLNNRYNKHIRLDNDTTYIKRECDYKLKNDIKFDELNSIDENGNVIPLQKNIINYTWYIVNRN
jgi:hypothetical protein